MSVETTLELLAARLRAIPYPEPRAVYAKPQEAQTIAEFPCIVLSLAPGTPHNWRQEALGLMRHDYTVSIWLFVGKRDQGLALLHGLCLPWPEAITRQLVQDLTLGGKVHQIGNPSDPGFISTRIGPIQWDTGAFWGVTCNLAVTEKIKMTMG